ncbi:MAG: TlpA family protein disulfide reductase [Gemmatimonadaceae bacterium]|nr:TlpA family protein disulfide reductase [Gemmatimonadaceae bacterium]
MTAKQQWMVVLTVIAVLTGGAWAATHFLGDELTTVTVGSDAPGFAAKTLDAAPRMKSLTDYRGDVLLLNVWATYCIPCRTEMPSIEALYKDFASKGLKVVAVSIDQAGFEEQIREFTREHALTFEILYDDTGAIQSIFRTAGVPETFVIGRDGVIRKRWIGAEDWNSATNRALITQLLAEPKS